MSIRPILTAGLLLACGLTPAFAKTKDKPDPYVPSGTPVDCISISQIRSSSVRDDRTIDFEVSGKKIYRNSLPNSCPAWASSGAFPIAPACPSFVRSTSSPCCSMPGRACNRAPAVAWANSSRW